MVKRTEIWKWIALILLVQPGGLAYQVLAAGPGTTGADVLKVDLGARANALGGAYSAVGNDSQILLYNPAALSLVAGSNAVFEHYAAYEEVTYELLGYSQPMEDLGIMGATLVYRTMPTIDNPGAPDAPVAVNDVVLTIGEGRLLKEWIGAVPPLLDRLAVGVAAKFIYSSLREAHAESVAVDLGAEWAAPAAWVLPVTASASLQNAGAPLRFLEQADPLPLCGRVALGATPLSTERHKFVITAECVLPLLDNGLRAAVGLEYTLAKVISLRAGYRLENAGNLNGPAAGLGVAFTAGNIAFHLDYAYRLTLWNSYETVANNHFISLGANF